MVTENLKKVEEKIEKACERSGRSRSDVTLIAVSKTKPIEMMHQRALTKQCRQVFQFLVKIKYRKL